MYTRAQVQFRHLLLAVCDRTGLVFKIIPDRGQVFLRYAIADGNGEEAKPFKAEWATVKVGRASQTVVLVCAVTPVPGPPVRVCAQDGLLFVGSVGRELVDAVRSRRACALPPLVDALSQEGRVVNHNSEWAKSIDANGRIENYDWRPVYLGARGLPLMRCATLLSPSRPDFARLQRCALRRTPPSPATCGTRPCTGTCGRGCGSWRRGTRATRRTRRRRRRRPAPTSSWSPPRTFPPFA